VPPQRPSNSAGHLLQFFRDGRAGTRRELGEITELSRSTIAARIDALVNAGYLREGGTASSSGGRRPTLLTFEDRTPTILAADLGISHARVAVTDASGEILAEQVLEFPIASGPTAVLTEVCDQFDALLEKAERNRDSICGIGMSVPGPVDFAAARVMRPPVMPRWHDFPVREEMSRRFPVPLYLDNDANMMALGEHRVVFPDEKSLLFIKVGTGLGAGIVVDGGVLRGVDGGAGDIGHVRISGSGAQCACGATGCLAASASGTAMARMLRDLGFKADTSRDVVALVSAGESAAVSIVRRAGVLVGEVLATAVSLINPRILVIGGDLAETGEHFLRGVHESLLQRTQPLATHRLVVTTSALGDRAGVAGAVAMVRDQVFSPEEVDRRLSAIAAERTKVAAGS
jgi:predicted NBD/HSP70 family sugar kinase